MFRETLYEFASQWRAVNGSGLVRVVVPVVLSLDMVHNIYLVHKEWKKSLQAWEEERQETIMEQTRQILHRVAQHCTNSGHDTWPVHISGHLGLSQAVTRMPSNEQDAQQGQHHAEHILEWLRNQLDPLSEQVRPKDEVVLEEAAVSFLPDQMESSAAEAQDCLPRPYRHYLTSPALALSLLGYWTSKSLRPPRAKQKRSLRPLNASEGPHIAERKVQ